MIGTPDLSSCSCRSTVTRPPPTKRFSFAGPVREPFTGLENFPPESETEWMFWVKLDGRHTFYREDIYRGTLCTKEDIHVRELWKRYPTFSWAIDHRTFAGAVMDYERRLLNPSAEIVTRGELPSNEGSLWDKEEGRALVLVREIEEHMRYKDLIRPRSGGARNVESRQFKLDASTLEKVANREMSGHDVLNATIPYLSAP